LVGMSDDERASFLAVAENAAIAAPTSALIG
jgi:hypothetical protein